MATIKKVINYDNMSIAASFPSGATFRWSISRSKESITIGFSNDRKIAAEQGIVIQKYMKQLKGDNAERFNAMAELLKPCISGSEVIGKMLISLKPIVSKN